MEPAPGLYVHLPWCVKKCPYCDFNSHAVRDTPPYADYVAAVCADLEHQAGLYAPQPFGSIFFGGGTPSLFQPEHIERILLTAQQSVGVLGDAEITLEANPGAIEHGSFKGYQAAGVTRISLGIQSFEQAKLTALGRVHSVSDAYLAVEAIHQANIAELNIDLMYGLPQQSVAESLSDINTAVSLGPTHISHYQLTIEPNTLFAVRTPTLPDGETCFDMQVDCQSALSESGFNQYEVSAYAKPGFEGNHNLNYWKYGDYLGVGAGAHGKVTVQDDAAKLATAGKTVDKTVEPSTGQATKRTRRTQKPKHPAQYLQDPLALVTTDSSEQECVFEFMLNRLRLNTGVTGAELAPFPWLKSRESQARFAAAVERGLLKINSDGGWSKTALGSRFLNDLQEVFLP